MSLLCNPLRGQASFGSLSRHRTTVRVRVVATAPAGANPSSGPPQEIVRISPQLLEAGGLDPSTQDPQNIAAFSNMLDKVSAGRTCNMRNCAQVMALADCSLSKPSSLFPEFHMNTILQYQWPRQSHATA